MREGLVSFSSAIVINGVASAGLAAGGWVESRKGLLERGREVDEAESCGAGSSKGEAGLLGSGDPARLRKGLLLERLRVRPGEGWSDKPRSKTNFLLAQSDCRRARWAAGNCRRMTMMIGDVKLQSPCMTQWVQQHEVAPAAQNP